MVCEKVGSYDICIVQGSDTNDVELFLTEDDGSPIDLSTATARMQIRLSKSSKVVYDELTTENGRISVESFVEEGETFWKVVLKFPNGVTSNYSWLNGVYDLELVLGGLVDRVIEGSVVVNDEVTRE